MKLSDEQLSRLAAAIKIYSRLIAESLVRKHLGLNDLHDLSDDSTRKFLIALKGIGAWTADIYLLSAFGRPDVGPLVISHWQSPFRK
jgi:3-methyladenine DNA glycosylase/8-oxoguanine DNA glycosylase